MRAEIQMGNVRRVACIGRRDVTDVAAGMLRRIGRLLASQGRVIVSGNARGSDQAYAAGANVSHPELVELWLPWEGYEKKVIVSGNAVRACTAPRYFGIAANHHPAWDRLSQGARRLFARNVGIIEGADLVLALPNHAKPGGGGTGHAMRVARMLGKPVVDLATEEGIQEARALLVMPCRS